MDHQGSLCNLHFYYCYSYLLLYPNFPNSLQTILLSNLHQLLGDKLTHYCAKCLTCILNLTLPVILRGRHCGHSHCMNELNHREINELPKVTQLKAGELLLLPSPSSPVLARTRMSVSYCFGAKRDSLQTSRLFKWLIPLLYNISKGRKQS